MQLKSLVQASYEALLHHAEGVNIVLLHPQSRYRSMVVAKLLAESPRPIFYYAMGPYDVNIVSFLSGFSHDLATQHPTFGRNLNQLGIELRHHKNDKLLQAVLQDLGELSDQPYFLVLDEFDASEEADDVQEFIEQMLLSLPKNCTVVINSRTLPRLPWVALVAQHSAIILNDTELINYIPSHQTENTAEIATLEVRALGPGRIVRDGEPIEEWEGHLPRLLFIFALERPVVTRTEICQAFWPDLDNDQAVNVFHVTKRRLHKALGFDALVHENGYYQVNPRVSIHYDVTDFVNALVTGRSGSPEEAADGWQRAIELYQGPFLQGHSEDWIQQQRQAYKAGYLEALVGIASLRLKANKPEHALRMLIQAAHDHDESEMLHREIMKIYAQLGRRSEAIAHYQTLAEALKSRKQTPEAETQQLYQQLMN